MLKHLVHSHHSKLHTFDDFYRNDSKPIKLRSTSNELISTQTSHTSSTSSSPTAAISSSSSPLNNYYSFYNVFSDFKSSSPADVLPEEDEEEENNEINPIESNPPTPVFYLEDEQHHTSSSVVSPSSSSSSPHWPSSIINRFRHGSIHGISKQNSVNDNHMNMTKSRRSDFFDSVTSKHRFLKRSETINHTAALTQKKSCNDDFPELSLPSHHDGVKKHRSFATLFHHFQHNHHHHHHHQQNVPHKKPNKSNSTGSLHLEDPPVTTIDHPRPKLVKQRALPLNSEKNSPVKKSPSTPILPKLASLFHRHHMTEQHKSRVGNLKARLHYRRHSPPLKNTIPKFQCQASNELIQEVENSQEQECQHDDYVPVQRPNKPVIMKRVHTWHNTFDLRPVEQCLEY